MGNEKPKVLVLGASGMLGAMVADVMARDGSFEVAATARSRALVETLASRMPEVEWREFAVADEQSTREALLKLPIGSWVVNAIGIIKPYIRDDNPEELKRALCVNSLFPHWLGEVVGAAGGKVAQIATDCVYSGTVGDYAEDAPHDALDVYGKSKSLGEANLPGMHHLRCSIIGPEAKAHRSLLDWFRGQSQGAELRGFANHLWNGVTTYHFGRLCAGIVRTEFDLERVQHVVPTEQVSKYELLQIFADNYGRSDLRISKIDAPVAVNRTLATGKKELNQRLWEAAGYPKAPSVPEMIAEMAAFSHRFDEVES